MKKSKLDGTSLVLLAGYSVTDNKETTASDKTEKVSKDKETQSGEVVFYITRHGKTLFNEMKKVQGWSDTPLTEPGVEVAKQLGEGLKAENITFDKVYSSDSGRAIETTELITEKTQDKKTDIIQDKNLR
nr:phosphoglycerate mutase family protein [Vagococcus martis]